MPNYAQQPSTSEVVGWENQRRALRDKQGAQVAQIGFDRGNAQQAQAVGTERLAQQYAQMREKLPNQFLQRGLFDSGIQKTAEKQRLLQENNARYDMATQYQQMLGQLNLNEQQANLGYAGGTASIDAAEAARRADLASQIRELL